MIEIKKMLKDNLRLHDLELLYNEVDIEEDSKNGKFKEVQEEIDKNSEDIEFNARRGFASGHYHHNPPQYSPPSYHYEQHAYHQPPPPAYKAVYEVNHWVDIWDGKKYISFQPSFTIIKISSETSWNLSKHFKARKSKTCPLIEYKSIVDAWRDIWA